VPGDLASLSPRAQEILRRADEQVASLRQVRPVTPSAGRLAEPDEAVDPQRLMDRVHAGLEAAAEHLSALQQAIEAIATELGVSPSLAEPAVYAEPEMPAQLAAHSTAAAGVVVRHDEQLAAAEEAPPTHAVSGATQDAARLVAIEMAVAGDTRENVGRRLREEFGIPDPQQILDDVFGPGTAAGSRMPWGGR
jgi:hypothetical protein